MILADCLATAPAEEALDLRCEAGACSVCLGLACDVHDECGGCRRVICAACDTETQQRLNQRPRKARP